MTFLLFPVEFSCSLQIVWIDDWILLFYKLKTSQSVWSTQKIYLYNFIVLKKRLYCVKSIDLSKKKKWCYVENKLFQFDDFLARSTFHCCKWCFLRCVLYTCLRYFWMFFHSMSSHKVIFRVSWHMFFEMIIKIFLINFQTDDFPTNAYTLSDFGRVNDLLHTVHLCSGVEWISEMWHLNARSVGLILLQYGHVSGDWLCNFLCIVYR